MRSDTFTLQADDGVALFVHRFLPEGKPRGVIHIAHGMAEHGGRYTRLAGALTAAGFAVYADDHRGHGQTARTEEDLGWVSPTGGWERLVRDLGLLLDREKADHPGLPLVLMGHSMGSFLVQSYLLEHGQAVQAAVLSGSAGKPSLLAQAGRVVARVERARLGPKGKSAILNALSFGDFNKKFAPNRTAFDWLSRDPAEVDAYVADPRCGFQVTTTMWIDLLDATARNADPARQARLPKFLPVYLFSGARDPVGESGKAVERLAQEYRRAGLTHLTMKLYPDARHETVNETNRDQVTADLVAWLGSVVPAR